MADGVGKVEGGQTLAGFAQDVLGAATNVASSYFGYRASAATDKATREAVGVVAQNQAAERASTAELVKFAIGAAVLGVTLALLMRRVKV